MKQHLGNPVMQMIKPISNQVMQKLSDKGIENRFDHFAFPLKARFNNNKCMSFYSDDDDDDDEKDATIDNLVSMVNNCMTTESEEDE